jgi:hypothetical protein
LLNYRRNKLPAKSKHIRKTAWNSERKKVFPSSQDNPFGAVVLSNALADT